MTKKTTFCQLIFRLTPLTSADKKQFFQSFKIMHYCSYLGRPLVPFLITLDIEKFVSQTEKNHIIAFLNFQCCILSTVSYKPILIVVCITFQQWINIYMGWFFLKNCPTFFLLCALLTLVFIIIAVSSFSRYRTIFLKRLIHGLVF